MAIDVKAARIPDRTLVQLLREHGLEAEPNDELEIVVSPTTPTARSSTRSSA